MSRGDSEAHCRSPHPDDTQTPASVCPKSSRPELALAWAIVPEFSGPHRNSDTEIPRFREGETPAYGTEIIGCKSPGQA